MELSSDNGSTYKPVVCILGFTLTKDTQTTTTDTQCGRIIGLGIIASNIAVQAVCQLYPTTSQVTLKDVDAWQAAQTSLKFRIQYPSTGSIGYGFYYTGLGNITNVSVVDQTNDPIKFNFTFLVQGDLNLTSPA